MLNDKTFQNEIMVQFLICLGATGKTLLSSLKNHFVAN